MRRRGLMRKLRMGYVIVALAAVLSLVVAACGSAERPTPEPPAPTATPRPTATAMAMAPTATTAPPTPTATPEAGGNMAVMADAPTASSLGGTMQLRIIGPFPLAWDTYNRRGWIEYSVFGPILNNLVWKDPYGPDGSYFSGDLAESWEFFNDGTTLTINLKQGVQYHNGTPFTARDAVYNLDRAINPRNPQATFFQARMKAMDSVQQVDDYVVQINLNSPSNVFFPALTLSGMLMYPSEFPFPERHEEWKASPIGTGPFKTSAIQGGTKYELVRNENYFKEGLPYLDAISMTNMSNEAGVAAFRAGKLHATNLDSSPTQYQLPELQREHGWVPVPINLSVNPIHLNQKFPFTDPKVRRAVDLAVDRGAVLRTWLRGNGSQFAPPMIPPELGGSWGISTKELETRLEYKDDKTEALAQAKSLLAEAGVNAGDITISVIGNTTYPQYAETIEQSIRDLGFKTKLEILPGGEATSRLVQGDFDIYVTTMSLFMDDPGDNLATNVTTEGAFNYGKWETPKNDELVAEQDRTFDFTKRHALITELQERVLEQDQTIPIVVRFGFHGYLPSLKNWPPNIQFLHDNIFRWEQVYLDG
jgi:peptide/nickel transport system substrate-binding protein